MLYLFDSKRLFKMRSRQCVCASFLVLFCLAYYMMAYGQTTIAGYEPISTIDHLELALNVGSSSEWTAATSVINGTSNSTSNSTLMLPPSPYLIDKPNLCQPNQTISLLIMVITSPNNTEPRMAIRQTWGTIRLKEDVKLAFVLGAVSDNESQSRIANEDSIYGDLIQGRFLDAYYNLTRKSVLVLKWAHTKCPNAKYVLKIDDDCFLHSANLQKFLSGRKETTAIFGRLWSKVKPIRDKKDKWAVPKEAFSGDEFPPYTGGPSYVITTGKALESLLKVVKAGQVPWLDLEDVYVTGLVAEKANIKRIHGDKFNVADFPKVCTALDVITYHRVSPDMMHLLWWVINDRKWKQSCESKDKHKALVEVANVIMANLHA
ncbi:Beta-1,3-galactosyltransferase 1 [Chamberlinius hualienensis]